MFLAVIQTRMGSSRMPGKCARRIKDNTMTGYVVDAVKQITPTCLIYPDTVMDKKAFYNMYGHNIFYHAGSEMDVLDRYIQAVKCFEDKIGLQVKDVIRLTSDCPLLYFFPDIIKMTIEQHLKESNEFTHNRGIDGYPSGLDVEIIKKEILFDIYDRADIHEKEHVTLYVKRNQEKYKIGNVKAPYFIPTKFSIDTEDDFNRVGSIVEMLNFRKELSKEDYSFIKKVRSDIAQRIGDMMKWE